MQNTNVHTRTRASSSAALGDARGIGCGCGMTEASSSISLGPRAAAAAGGVSRIVPFLRPSPSMEVARRAQTSRWLRSTPCACVGVTSPRRPHPSSPSCSAPRPHTRVPRRRCCCCCPLRCRGRRDSMTAVASGAGRTAAAVLATPRGSRCSTAPRARAERSGGRPEVPEVARSRSPVMPSAAGPPAWSRRSRRTHTHRAAGRFRAPSRLIAHPRRAPHLARQQLPGRVQERLTVEVEQEVRDGGGFACPRRDAAAAARLAAWRSGRSPPRCRCPGRRVAVAD